MTPEERKAIIAEIVEVMQSTNPQLSDEEMRWVRLAIELSRARSDSGMP